LFFFGMGKIYIIKKGISALIAGSTLTNKQKKV